MYDPTDYSISDDAMDLKNLLDALLEKTVAIYESQGVPLPARQYWTMGVPAADCEQVVVSFVQMYLGSPGDEAQQAQRCNAGTTAVITINVFRSVPSISPSGKSGPTADQIQAGSIPTAIDAWVLMSNMQEFDTWDGIVGHGPGLIATLSTPTPQGGIQQVELQLSMVVP